jgi:carbonic anhydrase/acetyltransferase-like protein (isoleucine patch superfamily)
MILPFKGVWPSIDNSAYISPGVFVIGDVVIGPESSIWLGTLMRADLHCQIFDL